MAILDGVGKVIGKASQGLSDGAKMIGSVARETRDNIARELQEKAVQIESQRIAEQEKAAEQAKKCPKCGQPISGISAVCPLCGYELRNAKTASSISELTRQALHTAN